MDPITAQRLFDEGKITQQTLDTVLAKSAPAEAPVVPAPFLPTPTGVPIAPVAEPITTPALEVQDEAIPTQVPPVAPAPIEEATLTTPEIKQIVTGETESITSREKKATTAAKQAQKDLETSFQSQQEAAAADLEAQRQKQTEEFNLNQAKQEIIAETSNVEQEIRNQGIEDLNSRLADLDTKTEALSNRKFEGGWASKSTGNKILGALSIAMGAYGSSIGGGPNVALSIINTAMDQEFAEFQDVTKNKIAAINSSRMNINTKRKLIQDQVLGLQAKKQADIDVVTNKIDALKNRFTDPEMKAKLDGLRAQLDQKRAESRLKFEKDLGETVTTNINRKLERVRVDPQTGAIIEEVDEADILVPGVGIGLNKDSTKTLRESADRKRNIKVSLGKLRARVEKMGTGTILDFTDTENELLTQFIEDIAVDMAKLKDPNSVARPSEVELFKNQLFEPGFFQTEGGVMEKLDQFEGVVDQTFESKIQSHLKPGTRVQETTAPPPPVIREINGVKYKFDPITKQNLGKV